MLTQQPAQAERNSVWVVLDWQKIQREKTHSVHRPMEIDLRELTVHDNFYKWMNDDGTNISK